MSNHPNMNYCAFENTAAAMRQCTSMITDAVESNEPLDLNRYDRVYFKKMSTLCEDMLAMLDEYDRAFSNVEVESD